MAYPTTAELIAASTVDELTGLTPEQQDALRALSIAAIESYTGQSFDGAVVATITVEPSTKRVAYLSRRLVALDGLSVGGSSLDATDVTLSDDGWRVELPEAVGGNYYVQAMREAYGDTARGFSGPLTVTGTFGWLETPDAVAQALRLDMEAQALAGSNALASTIAAYRKLGTKSVSQGNLRLELNEAPELSPDVTRLLEPYVRPMLAGAVV